MNKYLFTKEQEQKIIDYYLLPQSLSETAKHFGISSREVIKKVLIKNNISFHSETVLKKVHQNNIEQSNLLKYGYKNVFQDSRIKNKIKQTNKQKYGVENPQQVKNIKLKTKETNILKYGGTGFASSILNKKVQCIVKEKYGANNISNTYYFATKRKQLYRYGNEKFDSFPELAIYLYAIDHGYNIKREPIKFNFIFNNKMHSYFPDFEINGKLVEIKGDQFFKEDGTMQCLFDHTKDALFEAKHQCMLEHNVLILKSADYQFAIDYFNIKYKKDNFKY